MIGGNFNMEYIRTYSLNKRKRKKKDLRNGIVYARMLYAQQT